MRQVTSVITDWQSSARGCFKTSLTHPSIREVKYHTNQYWIRERIDHLSLFPMLYLYINILLSY